MLQESVEKQHLSQGQQTLKYSFSTAELAAYLFSRSKLKRVKITEPATSEETSKDCESCNDTKTGGLCTKHQHLETLRLLRSPEPNQLPRALSSFPPEVELCTSCIPSKDVYGVRAVTLIPEGTWIGPYEGKEVKPNELTPDTDTSYMWEVFHEGSLSHYLDGSDEHKSSWMRYIRCARYKGEQNTSVMQYFGNIYYRVFKDIPPGLEILVWYDDTCPNYFGIPLKMQDIGTSSRETSLLSTPQTLPVQAIVPVNTPITRNPSLYNTNAFRPMMPPLANNPRLPPIARQPTALPGYQVAYPIVSRDSLLHSSFANSSNYGIRQLNDAYSAAALYDSRVPYMVNGKSRSPGSVMGQTNVTNVLASHGISPYSHEHNINQPRTTNKAVHRRSTVMSPNQPATSPTSRDANVDQNGNAKDESYCEKLKLKQTGMTSSDNTITKLLSQIEEARIEEMKSKQRAFREKESHHSKEDSSETCAWKCGQCDKSFAQQQILQLHICSSVPEKPYECTYCPEAFSQPSELRTHAVCHSGKKPFKCGFCSRLFAGSTTLNNHIRTHTGERPFACEKCGKEFSQASQLSRHRRAIFECN